uniref:FAT atypical cadherin 3b n=1 Tax=Amphiprion ocellaris TaxID=80972 RepID=A0AAQ5XSP9_AMPOC
MLPLPCFSRLFRFIFILFFLFFPSTDVQFLPEVWTGQAQLLFTQPAYNASIFENSAARTYIGSEVKMGIVLGPPRSLDIKYSIVSGDSEVIFQAEEYVMGDFCFLRICTNGGSGAILNREVQDNYTLTVKASAQGGLEALTTVYIKVLDTNDLRPLFSPTSYSFVVSENAPLGASIGRVTATDADVGSNGEFYYFFKNRTELFAVHPTSGVITLTGQPRMDKQDRFELEVQVVDRGMKLYGNNGISSTARLILTVERVNEFAPVVNAVAVTPSWDDMDPVFVILTVEDKDEGISGDIEWVSIIEGDPYEQFMVDRSPIGNEYRVKTTDLPNWDTFPYGCNLTFQAKDRGIPPKFSNTQVVQLLVTKPDPVLASFEKDVYVVKLSEIAPPGTIVEVVKISPAPLSVNYSFSSLSDPMYFDINPLTGVIMTTRQLTRISQNFMVMEVIDIISQQQAQVQITIVDANDNSPVFNRPSYNIAINESLPVGTVVLVVSAVDEDKGENGYVTHTISGEQSLPFAIDQDTGEVRITNDVDFESSDDIYTFAVRASDWGSPYRRETEVNITIRVININDNRPLFEKVSCRGMISRDFPVNQTIVTLSAIDMDELGMVQYKILSGNELDYFNLNPESGALSLKQSLAADNLKNGIFTLKIVATDGEMYSDPTFVNVSVVRGRIPNRGFTCKDTRVAQLLAEKMVSKASAMARPRLDERYSDLLSMNKQAPQFEALPTSILVREDLDVGASVFQVRARDGDTGFNGRVLFSISDGNKDSCFNINMESGLITVLQPLDRERMDRYFLNITIYDQGIPQMSIWRLLTVIIEDANDNDPQFYQDGFSALVSENSAIGMEVITITAFDRDMGQNGQLSYVMITSVPQFGIDSETGSVFVASHLDRETSPLFMLKIEVRDKAERGTRRSSVTTLRIILEDVNDCSPAFIPGSYSARVLEDIPPGAVITWVQAQDPDIGLGGQVRYSLVNDFNGTFEVGDVTVLSGALRIRRELDFEKQPFFNLTLLAEDRGVPRLYSQTFVEVEVVDVNENLYAPYFPDFAVRGSVKENSRVGTSVLTVSAKDDDKGRDGMLRYSVRGGSGLGAFTIDEDTGVIYTAGILDCETKDSYWLSVFATDRGVAPLSASIEVFIQVEDVNDNAPLTSDPIYHPVIMENSPKDVSVIRIQAQDPDLTATSTRLSYRISAGNPQNFFTINPKTGLITTTARKLDREQQAEHFLEVTVIDGPVTTRQSTVWVIVHIEDENDNPPTFPEVTYRISLPERDRNKRSEPVYRVFAYDRDSGANGNITYSIIDGNEDEKFSIDPRTAMVSSKKMATAGSYDILTIKAEDSGEPPLWSTVKLHVEWIRKPVPSSLPLQFTQRYYNFSVTETTAVAQPVGVVAVSQSSTPVWFSIIGKKMNFDLQVGVGTLVVAKPLDAEVQSVFNMTIQVTDGTNFATVFIRIQDSNDNPPVFSQSAYDISVSEDVPADMELLRVRASDVDERARLSFSIYGSVDPASMRLFRVNPGTGMVYTADRLDYEARTQHILTVMVRKETWRTWVSTACVLEDSNDNIPYFTSTVYDAVAYENSPAGTSVLQVTALDKDNGINGQLTYSMEAGNSNGVFGIDNATGLIFIAKDLDLTSMGFYTLTVRVTDSGFPPLMATASVRISLMLSDFSKPKFTQKEYQTEIMENSKIGAYVTTVSALSRSALIYDITRGNEEQCFVINHHTGVITTRRMLDFEKTTTYFLMVRALSMAGVEASTTVIVQIGDVNDSPPVFQQLRYVGAVSEAAPVNSVVLGEDGNPLVIQATDKDRNHNALLVFQIIDETARMFFSVDSGTGSIRTIASLDYETFSEFLFRVHVRDSGQPSRSAESPAEVIIKVMNINDSPPKFFQDTYETVLLLPTYLGVEVLKVEAFDPDMTSDLRSVTPQLVYSLVDSNVEYFAVERYTGVVTILNQNLNKDRYRFNVKVITVLVREAIDSGLLFTYPVYSASIPENIPNVTLVTVVNTVGHRLNEPLKYTLLNPGGRFTIRPTCGVVLTTGVPFDREERKSYELVVEVSREDEILRVARATVQVQVEDVNDNTPEFVNLPYYAVVQVEAEPGSAIFRVSATDQDFGMNGDVTYSLKEDRIYLYHADLSNAEYKVVIVATDGGYPTLSSEVELPVTVVNKAMPVFDKPFYGVTVREDVAVSTSVLCINASTPEGQSIIFTITDGDPSLQFDIGFDTGIISVIYPLDYETTQYYRLTVKATDTLTGAKSEVDVDIVMLDVNDNPPLFLNTSYSAVLAENSMIGTTVLQLIAVDQTNSKNSQKNAAVSYQILSDIYNSTDYFHIDSSSGLIFTARLLDYELIQRYNFIVRATDSGDPALSSDVSVTVIVTDTNDNPPNFSQALYEAFVSELENAPPGSKVIQVRATDEDSGLYGQITYSFINDLGKTQFTIDADGVISTVEKLDREHPLNKDMVLTVMALDGGGRASFCTVRVVLADENDNAPRFRAVEYRMSIKANVAKGSLVTQIQATDPDAGSNGRITYSLYSEARLSLVDVLEVNSGWMMTKSTVDHLQGTVLSFFVKATDCGSPAKHSLVSAFIHVVPADAFVPSFSQPQYSFTIPEDTAVGTALGSVYMGPGQTGFFTVVGGETIDSNKGGTFLVERESGLIRLVKPLDYEAVSSFRFKVAATARRDLIESISTVDLEVKILDVNDNKPVFETNTYVATVMEGMPVGTRVVQARALDPDWGSNGQVSVFAIDSKTGWITTVSQMDHEACSSYSFEVVASDLSETQSLSSTTVVTITVSDVNDNPPWFERELYRGAVKESDPLGEVVAVLKTKDRDGTDQNRLVSFYITGGNPRGVFGLALVQGEWKVYVSGLLDREQQDWYLLNITASDGLYVARTAVEVSVMDANDNSPICNQAVYSASFPEDIPTNKGILTVGATDADSGSSAEIQYSLFGIGVEDFYMDANTGELRTATVMDREMTPTYKLIAQATDGGGLFCRSDISLKVLDVNDNAPLFSSPHYLASVYENAAPKALLTRLQASDPDEGLNRTVAYSLVNSVNDFFSIDPVTGIVILEKSLDRESRDSYRVRVQATDRAGQQGALSSQVDLTILVLDVNDNAPVFQRRDYGVTVPEDVAVGTEVIRVLATSADIGPNAEITYNIRSGNELRKFIIDTKLVADDLDFEVCKDYYLTVEAWDSGNPPLSTATMVTIELMDVNDNAPAFTQDIYSVLVSEDASVGQTITRVLAEDLDSQVNGRITYSILKGDRSNQFWIDPVAGLLKVNKRLDRELVSRYALLVQAFDSGSPAMSSTVTINIDISDVNDNPPVFTPPNSTAIIQVSFTTLLKLSVSDKDSPKNGPPFEFRIVSGNEGSFFALDQTGTLRTSRVFGPEASDSGKPRLSTSSWVFLRVIGNSQYKPTVSPLEIFIVMATDTFQGGPISRIYATDRDPNDVLSFTQKPQPKSMFKINRQDGSIVALPGLEPGRYQMNATVSDGRFAVIADVSVQVEQVTDLLLRSALTLRFSSLSPEDLLGRYLNQIKLTLRGIAGWKWSPGQQDPLHILSVQPVMGTSDVDLLVAVERPETSGSGGVGGFYSPQELSAKLEEAAGRGQIRGVLSGAVVVSSACSGELDCGDRVCEILLVMEGGSPVTYSTERVGLVSLRFSRTETCTCPGEHCTNIRSSLHRYPRAPVRLWPLASDSSFFFGAQVRPLNTQGERPSPGPGRSQGGAGFGERGARGPPRAQDGFQGCLGSLMLNGNELPLQNKRSRYAEIAGLSEVKLGCVLYPDPCVSQPCLNGAICSSLPSGGFTCSCSVGFTGVRCEIELTSCMPNPCQNGGDCKPVGSAFLCGCPRGLMGLIKNPHYTRCGRSSQVGSQTKTDCPEQYFAVPDQGDDSFHSTRTWRNLLHLSHPPC